MAMAFTFRVLENSVRNYVLEVVGVDTGAVTAYTSDGTSNGILAANGFTPTTSAKVRRIVYNTTNCMARLQWHQTANAELANLSGFGDLNLDGSVTTVSTQGIINDKGAGSTGDIDLSSIAIAAVTTGTVTAALTLVIFIVKGQ